MERRLFFGMEVRAPWPERLPKGRLLDAVHRHLTLAFLGNVEDEPIKNALRRFPEPAFKVGCAATFDACLLLPHRHPRVVAWHVEWLGGSEIADYYGVFTSWLVQEGISIDLSRDFMPHVTLARFPFDAKGWREHFHPLPLIVQDIHLYESVGNLRYEPVWSYPLLPPFEEIEHTADRAYRVRGATYDHLYYNGGIALAFEFPALVKYILPQKGLNSLAEVIEALGAIVSRVDAELGCPFKAVCYHTTLEVQGGIMCWEMVVDV